MCDDEERGQVVNFENAHRDRLHELQERRRQQARQRALAELWRIREATGLYPPHMLTGGDPDEAA
ncbi:MAG: hypothetical protein AAGA21_16375 [Pseudomonadota bacterium]